MELLPLILAKRRNSRRAELAAATLALVLSIYSAPGLAQDASKCVAAHDRGHDLRLQGKLIASKRQFVSCADAGCPKLIREECESLLSAVEASTPTVVFAATDSTGKDVGSISVFVDGRELREAQPGRAVPLDPGQHRLRLVAADGRSADETLVAHEGEKNRTLRLVLPDLAAGEAAGTPDRASSAALSDSGRGSGSPGPPLPAWILGGVGVAALGSFTYFGLTGKSDEEALEGCAPRCPDSDVDELYRKYLIADVSLGVGVVALGAATYLFLRSSSTGERVAIGVAPGKNAGSVGVRLRF